MCCSIPGRTSGEDESQLKSEGKKEKGGESRGRGKWLTLRVRVRPVCVCQSIYPTSIACIIHTHAGVCGWWIHINKRQYKIYQHTGERQGSAVEFLMKLR